MTMWTVTEAARALRVGELTSVGLTEAVLATADDLDDRLGVYACRFDESALAAARRADEELAAGVDRGVLHGIPCGIKDTIATAAGPMAAHSLVFERHWLPEGDARAVALLRGAGAVITGKTTATEFGCGLPDSGRPFPIPVNPWDPERWAGGSSSGSASGVATGMFLAGLGGDTAGSIRMPAAFCGITGLAPTFGRVSTAGCVPLGFSLDRVGPLARTAADCAALLGVLDPDDDCRYGDTPDMACDMSAVRIGVVREHHLGDRCDPALPAVFDEALAVFTALGTDLVEITLPLWRELITALFVTAASEGLAYHRRELAQRWHGYGVAARGLLATGALTTGSDYVQAQRVRSLGQAKVDDVFLSLDAIVCPTASIGAPPLHELANAAGHQDDGVFGLVNTPYWSALANPVVAVPMGTTAAGLPLSMQMAGPVGADHALLRIAAAYQAETGWHRVESTSIGSGDGGRAPLSRGSKGGAPAVVAVDVPPSEAPARHMLAASGLAADGVELGVLHATYAERRRAVDALFDVADIRTVGLPSYGARP